jgi:hypothetical protein
MKRQEIRDKRQKARGEGAQRAFLSHVPCLLFLISCLFLVSACGVKNNLEKPNRDFPRTYPVK